MTAQYNQDDITDLKKVVLDQSATIDKVILTISGMSTVIDQKTSKKEVWGIASLLNFITLFLVLLALIAIVFIGLQNRRIFHKFNECTVEVTSKCYQEGVARTAEAVGFIDKNMANRIEALRRDLIHLPPETSEQRRQREAKQFPTQTNIRNHNKSTAPNNGGGGTTTTSSPATTSTTVTTKCIVTVAGICI